MEMLGDISYDEATLEIRGKIKYSLHFTSLSKTDYKTICFTHRRRCFGSRSKQNHTKKDSDRRSVRDDKSFLVNCSNSGEQKQKQPTLTASCFQHSEFERNVSLLSVINLTLNFWAIFLRVALVVFFFRIFLRCLYKINKIIHGCL